MPALCSALRVRGEEMTGWRGGGHLPGFPYCSRLGTASSGKQSSRHSRLEGLSSRAHVKDASVAGMYAGQSFMLSLYCD